MLKRLLALLLLLPLPRSVHAAAPRLSRAPRPYDVRHYQLRVRLDERTGKLLLTTRIRFVATARMEELELDAVGLHPAGAWLVPAGSDGEPGAAAAKTAAPRSVPLPVLTHENPQDAIQGTLSVTLPLKLSAGSEATVEIETAGEARKEQDGFFVVRDPDFPRRPPVYLTHFEPLGARRFFPCHDDPADKATFDVTVETGASMEVLSNGRRMEAVALPGGKRRVRYAMAKPMSTYLLALAVGRFDHDTLDEGGVPLDVYLVLARKDAARLALHTARDAMESFQHYWDYPYPFERYGQVEAPLYPAGALETTTLTTSSRGSLVLPAPEAELAKLKVVGTVAHELAHQWFGDLVTMTWWDDLWLNESLATYAAARFVGERFGEEGTRVRIAADLHESYFRTEDGPRSHPIMNQELLSLEDAFDSINYAKGAQVLRMIEELLGRERMRAGLTAYLRQHAYKNASSADLLAALAEAQRHGPAPPRKPIPGTATPPVDTPVQEFARSWLVARGYPVLSVAWRYDAARKQTVLSVKQRPNHPGDSTRWHVRLPVGLHRRGADPYDIETLVLLTPARADAELAVPTPAAPGWVSFNPGGLALAEIEAPSMPEAEANWALAARSDPDATARYLALLQLLRPALRRDGLLEQLPPAAEGALAEALLDDPSPYVRSQLAQRLARARGTPGERLRQAALLLSRGPRGVDPADALAVMMVRAGGVELLGKVPGPEAGQVLAGLLLDRTLPIDLVGPCAQALARRGDDASFQALQRGAQVQRPRGFAFVSKVLGAYGALGNPRRLPEVLRVVRENLARRPIIGEILMGIFYNEDLRQSPELPALIAELVLGSPQLDEDQQAMALRAMEGLRTREARAVLESVRQRARAARIRILANLFLQKTFG